MIFPKALFFVSIVLSFCVHDDSSGISIKSEKKTLSLFFVKKSYFIDSVTRLGRYQNRFEMKVFQFGDDRDCRMLF